MADEAAIVPFRDRQEAGEKLAHAVLAEMALLPAAPCVVYALPRGGLPVAAPVARLLGCPLDVIVAKKITRPGNTELAIGAVTAEGHVVWSPNHDRAAEASVQQTTALQQAQAHAQSQLARLTADSPRYRPEGAIALLVDDGIATGMTIAAAAQSLRSQNAAQVWLCAPVAPLDLLPFLHALGDRVVILATPSPFYSVSRFYRSFNQVTTEEASVYLR